MNKKSLNQSINEKSEKLIRYYRIPVSLEKKDVLDTILKKAEISENRHLKVRSLRPVRISAISAAATIFLLITLYLFTANDTFRGKINETATFRLPDNSRVIVRDDSEISYRRYFWNRKVHLEGTAYFEVEKGNLFQVITGTGKVEVLGTRFIVSAAKNRLDVKCFEGIVRTSTKSGSYLLEQGNSFTADKTEEKKEPDSVTEEFPDFARFNRSFSNTNLRVVAEDLEKFFGVQIELRKVSERSFSGSIHTGKLESALEIVCQSMQLKYRYTDKNKIIIY